MPDAWPTVRLAQEAQFVARNQDDVGMNACIGYQFDRSAWWAYSDGFQLAARSLVEQLEERQSVYFPLDVIVYPTLHLYRHHFELLLKMLIRSAIAFQDMKHVLPKTHDLGQLWARAMPLVETCFPKADWSQNPIVTRLLGELQRFDPTSQSSRYPVDRDGSRHFERHDVVNLREFAMTAEQLSEYLREVLGAIESVDDQQRG